MNAEVHFLCLVKGTERYVFLFDEDQRADAIRTMGRWASDPDLSFSWYDVAVMAKHVRDLPPLDGRFNFRAIEDYLDQLDNLERRSWTTGLKSLIWKMLCALQNRLSTESGSASSIATKITRGRRY